MGIIIFHTPEEVLDAAGKYDTISHVWGQVSKFHDPCNELNNHTTIISSEEKLKQVHEIIKKSDEDGIPIWMDVYSIAQNDIEVKSHQVALMYEIYRNCRQCIVLMSPKDEETLVNCVEVTKILEEFKSEFNEDDCESLCQKFYDKVHNVFPEFDIPTVDYFSRLWTLQESTLPPEVMLHTSTPVDLDEFSRHFRKTVDEVSSLPAPSWFVYSVIKLRNCATAAGLETCSFSHDSIQEMSELDKVREFWYRSPRFCSVPHDVVYSVFSLMGWELVPDYSIPYTDLLNSVMPPLIEKGIVDVAPLSIKFFREGRGDAIPDPEPEPVEDYCSWLGKFCGAPKVASTFSVATRWYNGIPDVTWIKEMEGTIRFEGKKMHARVFSLGPVFLQEITGRMAIHKSTRFAPPECAKYDADNLLASEHAIAGISVVVCVDADTNEVVGGHLRCGDDMISLNTGSCDYVVTEEEELAFVGHTLCLINKERNRVLMSFSQGAVWYEEDDEGCAYGPYHGSETYEELKRRLDKLDIGWCCFE